MSIADKLTAIAENTPKVYDAGYKKAVETLCPPINETGVLIQCCPIEGYPLTIAADFALGDDVPVTICGKNLYNKTAYPLATNGYPYSNTSASGTFSTSANYRRTGFIPVAHLAGQTIVLSHCPNATNPGMSFYTRIPNVGSADNCKDAWCGGTTGASIKVPDNAKYMVFCVKAADAEADVQIEVGSVTTDYEPYVYKERYLVNPDGTSTEIEPFKGINTIFAYCSDTEVDHVTVTGIADPIAEIERLTDILTAMGGNAVSTTEEG